MLKTPLTHPQILSALGRSGHGTRVLVADGNYPFDTGAPAGARRVYLNLRRGMVPAPDVLEALVATIPVESAVLMETPDGEPVPLHSRYREILGPGVSVTGRRRHDFYDEARSPLTALVIATGEERRFANVLLTIGVVRAAAEG